MKLRSVRLLPFAAAVVFSFGSIGCATHYLPNTDVEATELNRRVIEFCEEYRRAVERRNVPLLLKFAHPNYYEDGGTVSTSDDLDYAGLREYLEGRFKKTSAIRYEIRYRDVKPGRNNTIYVDYTYTASFKVLGPDGEEVWRRSVADNRLELVPEGESFRILSGM
ncbi:MAG: hypothetical protein DIU78_012680 [Pseudomonadota bacterium]